MTYQPFIRLRATTLLAGFAMLLSGCFISPGKFTSELTLLESDQFTFTYEGEVYFLALSKWMQAQQERNRPEFRAYCYGAREAVSAAEAAADDAADAAAEVASEATEDDETVRSETIAVPIDIERDRECTPEEEAEQRAEWEERQAARKERDRQQMEQLSKLIGGIDPTDPDAEAELAKVLQRQKGFNRVVAKGDGLFEVSYSISGTLSHDYMFPMMEDFPTTNPFVQLFLRQGNVVRINAPGFAPMSQTSPMMPIMGAAAGLPGGRSDEFEALSDVPPVDGTFTIITTGEIRANNTDEGPTFENGRKRLTWTINARSKGTPTALIAMPR